MKRPTSAALALALAIFVGACAHVPPRADERPFLDRIETRSDSVVTVSAAVLSDRETKRVMGSGLAAQGVQPLWLEIENAGDEELLLMLVSIDSDYFSAAEAAWKGRRFLERRRSDRMKAFADLQVPFVVPPERRVAGYVFTNRDPGVKAFAVELIGDQESHNFNFEQVIPGLRTDLDASGVLAGGGGPAESNLSSAGLRSYLETVPGVASGGKRRLPADPLNFVIVGDAPLVLATFARRGWDVTEALTLGSAWRTVASTLFKSAYRTSPISPLFLFGRRQDFALQKTRGNVDERNHLRLWRAPVDCEGEPVWIGQISRDIGVKLTRRTIVTHRIDPDVDDARIYLLQDLIGSSSVDAVGFVGGVGESTREAPRKNYTHDPYHTDGYRLVVFLTPDPTATDEIDWLDWEWPTVASPGVVNEALLR